MLNTLIAATTEAKVYFGFCIAFFVLMAISSIAMIIIVILQKGTGNDMSAIMGGTDSFFSKNKVGSFEGKLRLFTVITAGLMLLSSILFFVFTVLLNRL
jgi:protein translocase SecG subunit